MHANIFPFRQDRHNCMKRIWLTNASSESGRDEQWKEDHRHQSN
jgi:hypothetical protein